MVTKIVPDASGMYTIASPRELPNPPAALLVKETLTAVDANRTLKREGYGAEVRSGPRGHRLVAGNRSVLLRELNLESIYGGLLALGVKSKKLTFTALSAKAQLLDAGRTDRTWTEPDHGVRRNVDFLDGNRKTVVARTAVDPIYLGAPFDLTTITIPKDRIAIDYALPDLPKPLADYAAAVLAAFDNKDGTFSFPVHNQQLAQIYPGKNKVRHVQAQATSSDRTMALHTAAGPIRLKMDLSQLNSINAPKPLDPEIARHDMQLWSICDGLFQSDPQLKLYAATQPEVVTFTDQQTGISNLGRYIVPYPPHPKHPEGTLAVSLKSLLTESAGEPLLLESCIANRPNKQQNETEFFVESFIRPLVAVFRATIDNHGIGLYNLHEKNLAFETTNEINPTGRVVINDFGDVWPDKALMKARGKPKTLQELGVDTSAPELHPALKEPRSLIRYGMNTLYDSLGALAIGLSKCSFNGRSIDPEQIREAMNRVIREEFRFLRPDTAAMLGTDHPLAELIHSIDPAQQQILDTVLDNVAQRTRDRRSDPSLAKATVVIDLDLCALTPRLRAEKALLRVATDFQIPELAQIDALPGLPAYHRAGFEAFLEAAGIADRPGLHRAYEDAFFDKSTLHLDQLTPGLVEMVRRIEDEGGVVVFNTGRREFDRKVTEETLAKAGLNNVELLMMPNGAANVEEAKAANARKIKGSIVAVFDDLAKNRELIGGVAPGAMLIDVAAPGFYGEGREVEHRVHTFEADRRKRGSATSPVESYLSGTHSVDKLPLSTLRLNKVAIEAHSVSLDPREARDLVKRFHDGAIENAPKLVQKAIKAALKEVPHLDGEERTAWLIHYLMTHKPYVKGRGDHWPFEQAKEQILGFMQENKPISIAIPSFPIKEHKDRMKATGFLPDLAEMGAFLRMKELDAAIASVYPPGFECVVLMDGHHYRPHFGETPEMIEQYIAKLREYVAMVGAEKTVKLVDYDELALERGGPELIDRRQKLLDQHLTAYREAFAGLDVTADPVGALEAAKARDPAIKGDVSVGDITGEVGDKSIFRDLFSSLLFCAEVPTPKGKDRQAWGLEVLADIFNVHPEAGSKELVEARKVVLQRTWDMTSGYLAALQTDRELKYSSFVKDSIRATIHPKPGQYGFAVLGSGVSHLTPWHGTAAITARAELSVDFIVSLQDQGFVPLYVPWLGSDKDLVGERQPFAMVPVKYVNHGALKRELLEKLSLHE